MGFGLEKKFQPSVIFWVFPSIARDQQLLMFSAFFILFQVSQSQEHQQYITFLQKLLGPLLEAYSSTAIFIHNFSGPVRESEYLQKLHKYLIARTEKNVAVYGTSNSCFQC